MNKKQEIQKLLFSSAIPTVGLLSVFLIGHFWFQSGNNNHGHLGMVLYFFLMMFLLAFLVRLLELGAIILKPLDHQSLKQGSLYDFESALFRHYVKPQLIFMSGLAVFVFTTGGAWMLMWMGIVTLVLMVCSVFSAAHGAKQLEACS